MHHIRPLLAAALALIAAPAYAQAIDPAVQARIDRILKATPLIDGHNDLPEQLRENYGSKVETTDVSANSDKLPKPLMTDMTRMHAGRVGGQFWSVYISAAITGDTAIRETIEQIDIVKRLVVKYPRDLELANTAADIVRIHKAGKIASLIGIEGGHQIGNSLPALRAFHALGARYMTITHFKNTDWADSATDDPRFNGITDFGKAVIGEMNRIGMIPDLSHVSPATMKAVLAITRAPVIFSHSTARALDDHPRGVPDDVLTLLKANGGIVMVAFVPSYISPQNAAWNAAHDGETARLKALYIGQPDRVKVALGAWEKANPVPAVTIAMVADHIDHIAKVAGHDHVGIGGDLDGIGSTVQGLDGVDCYPRLFAELIRRGWSDADLAKLAGGNMLRVLRAVEAVAAASKDAPPATATVN